MTGPEDEDVSTVVLQQRAEWVRMQVAEGDDKDECPVCGIWRKNAGWLKESCGQGFMQPGCFVTDEVAA